MAAGKKSRSDLRLFVALDLPDEVRRLTSSWGREVARAATGMRAVPAANTHITLAFLGDRPSSEIAAITSALDECESPAVQISLGAPLRLPRRRPRALALEIHDQSGRLAALQSGLAGALAAAIGWKAGRAFRPHLTAVRLSRSARADHLHLPVTPSIEFVADSVSLQRSELTPDGARYEEIASVRLAR